MKRLILIIGISFSAQAHASFWDDLISLFSGSDQEEVRDAAPEPQSGSSASEVDTSASEQGAGLGQVAVDIAASSAAGLMPMITQTLGVTEAQARGGLGAMFVATKAVLPPEDFDVLADALPGIDGLMNEAPPVNSLLSSALKFGGAGEATSAATNLLAQFNSLGLDPGMIAGFSNVAADYLKQTAPEASGKLAQAVETVTNAQSQ